MADATTQGQQGQSTQQGDASQQTQQQTQGQETNNSGNQQEGQQQQGQTFESLEAWLGSQPEELQGVVKPLVEKSVTNLRTALNDERNRASQLDRTLKDLQKKLEENSEARKQLDEILTQRDSARREADFFLEAGERGITKPRAIYLIATNDPDEKYMSVDGRNGRIRVEWEALKADYPEFFPQAQQQTTGVRANAGNGTNQSAGRGFSMNDLLRSR